MMKKLDKNHSDAIADREAKAKLDSLMGQDQQERDRRDEMESAYVRYMSTSGELRIKTEATALLDGRELAVVTTDDLQRQRRKCEVLAAAVEEQTKVASAAAERVSKHLHELNRAEYVAIQKRILNAVDELAAANDAEAKFFDELRDAGCTSIRFRSMAVTSIGRASDKQSRAVFHRRELKEFLPEALA